MSSTKPLITPEEMRCLLAVSSTASDTGGPKIWHHLPHWGATLWLVKGIFLYVLLMGPGAANGAIVSTSYLWLRGGIEGVVLAVFWVAAWHPRGRTLACASLLVACTTLLMDMLSWITMGV
jgi:hypothetical protein